MLHKRAGRPAGVLIVVVLLVASLASGCSTAASKGRPAAGASDSQAALAPSAYQLDPSLGKWVDPETGYDTTREWKLEGGSWPVAMVMSPSQSPQLLAAERDRVYEKALGPLGITPVVERIDLPPRTFHALQRSKWPFVYMPLAVFTDYVRSMENQGRAGGLQYVALAGSTAGGGYVLLAKDPAIRSIKDLAGKTVAQDNSNPVPATLFAAAARRAGLLVGTGPGEVRYVRGVNGQHLNDYMAGKIDAVISLAILKRQLAATGSRQITDFSDVGYTPNYTVLAVERSVLEKRPDVVEAFLRAHYDANKLAERQWDTGLKPVMMRSWNEYFRGQKDKSAKQRPVPDQKAFDTLLGDMRPEDRIDPKFLADCFALVTKDRLWGWKGRVDVSRLADLALYDKVLSTHGEPPQSSASK